jgi:hypothetical protein
LALKDSKESLLPWSATGRLKEKEDSVMQSDVRPTWEQWRKLEQIALVENKLDVGGLKCQVNEFELSNSRKLPQVLTQE